MDHQRDGLGVSASHQALLWLGGPDPAFSTVVQLAHFDGTNGSTTFTNSCPRGNTMINNAGSTISTAQSVFGGASLRIDNSVGAGIFGSALSDYQFGSNDWTIEFRFRPDAVALINIYDGRVGSANAACPTIYTLANGTLIYFVSNADRITSASGVITAGAWQAIAVSRVSGTTRMFVNGSQVGSNYTDGTNYNVSTQVSVGSKFTTGQKNAYYDELRVSNGAFGAGAGRYAANYTPAAIPFPNY